MLRRVVRWLRQRFRRQRYAYIRDIMGVDGLTEFMVDLGGGRASFFAAMAPEPTRVLLVDIGYDRVWEARHRQPSVHAVVGDGAHLPLADHSMGLVVCNSVIEHVDDPDGLAAEIRRVGRSYFVQTPNGDFPLETHSFIGIPFYKYIPWQSWRGLIARAFGASADYLDSVQYLSEHRLRLLFPDATLACEKVFGATKSFYLYRRNG